MKDDEDVLEDALDRAEIDKRIKVEAEAEIDAAYLDAALLPFPDAESGIPEVARILHNFDISKGLVLESCTKATSRQARRNGQ